MEYSDLNVDRTAPDSHVNYRFLCTPEKDVRLQHMHSELRCTKLQKKRLKQKLEEAIEKDGVVVDPATHDDLQTIVADNEAELATKYPDNSFQYIFWKQQEEAARMKNASSSL